MGNAYTGLPITRRNPSTNPPCVVIEMSVQHVCQFVLDRRSKNALTRRVRGKRLLEHPARTYGAILDAFAVPGCPQRVVISKARLERVRWWTICRREVGKRRAGIACVYAVGLATVLS